ncbi:MAG: hypothetical protein ABSA97_13725 [Verrucomicrobiia bacterium]
MARISEVLRQERMPAAAKAPILKQGEMKSRSRGGRYDGNELIDLYPEMANPANCEMRRCDPLSTYVPEMETLPKKV